MPDTTPSPAASALDSTTIKNIVLVHGAFADGTSWHKVIRILEARGFHVTAVQNPLTSLKADVEATRRAIARQDWPVVLAGHSWGGAVITEAGENPQVEALVYVAAYAPDAGKSANETSLPFGVTDGQKHIQADAEGYARLSREGLFDYVAEGLSLEERGFLFTVQGETYGPMFDEKLTHAAWKTRPSWHIIATEDRILPVAMQQDAARRTGGTAAPLPTCHIPILQEPEKVADVLTEAARHARKTLHAAGAD